MRRIALMLAVSLVMAAMLMFAGPASAQGGCNEFGQLISGTASSFKAAFGQVVSGNAPVNERVHTYHEQLC